MSLRERAIALHSEWQGRAEERERRAHTERVENFHRRAEKALALEYTLPPARHGELEITIDGLTFRSSNETSPEGFWQPIELVTHCAECKEELTISFSTLMSLGEILSRLNDEGLYLDLCAKCRVENDISRRLADAHQDS
jgi:hypothetical protein